MSREKLIRKLKTNPDNWQAVADEISLRDDFSGMLQKLDAHQYIGTYELIKAINEAWELLAIEAEATEELAKPIREICLIDTHA